VNAAKQRGDAQNAERRSELYLLSQATIRERGKNFQISIKPVTVRGFDRRFCRAAIVPQTKLNQTLHATDFEVAGFVRIQTSVEKVAIADPFRCLATSATNPNHSPLVRSVPVCESVDILRWDSFRGKIPRSTCSIMEFG
jgi:hypothetical protein